MIRLTVTEAMRLRVEPLDVGWDGEQNARVFEISQPDLLNSYTCRVEIATAAGKSFHLVSDHKLPITSDIAVRGLNSIQFVYYDGDEIVRKSSVAQYRVGRSINAIDPGDPEFADGLAQLQAHAFVKAEVDGDTLIFSNFDGEQVGEVVIGESATAVPPAGIPVSTGEGWGDSLDPATVLRAGGGPDVTGNLSVTAPGQITGTGVINIAAVMAGSFMATNELRFREQTLIVDGFNTAFRSRFSDTGYIFSNCMVSFAGSATLLLAANPTLPLHAATKQYVDALEARVAALEATVAELAATVRRLT